MTEIVNATGVKGDETLEDEADLTFTSLCSLIEYADVVTVHEVYDEERVESAINTHESHGAEVEIEDSSDEVQNEDEDGNGTVKETIEDLGHKNGIAKVSAEVDGEPQINILGITRDGLRTLANEAEEITLNEVRDDIAKEIVQDGEAEAYEKIPYGGRAAL